MATGRVTVFGSSRIIPTDALYEDGRRLGRLLAEAGYAVCTGGYAGAMEAVSRGAREAGGISIGVTVTPWSDRQRANVWLTEELPASDLFQRMLRLIASDAYVALPGGLGTLGEVAVTWNLLQTDSIPHSPLILVGTPWRAALDCLAGGIRIEPRDLDLVRLVDTVEEIIPLLPRAPRR